MSAPGRMVHARSELLLLTMPPDIMPSDGVKSESAREARAFATAALGGWRSWLCALKHRTFFPTLMIKQTHSAELCISS